MIRDLEKEQPGIDEYEDICVVGAGAAGIALAVELAKSGKSVLLLEGGGATLEEASQNLYGSEVVGLKHRGVHSGRFRTHGGTTTKWGGQILELDEIDFEKREWVRGSGWPFAKSELQKYYARALYLEGLGDVLCTDSEIWKRLGLAQPQLNRIEPYFSRWCPEPNFAILHRKVLEGSAVKVWLHANAIEMEMEDEVVRSLRCRTLTGKVAQFRANQFVFCLGAIESTRFFLQPRAGALPWNASGMLGKHFHDHVDANAALVKQHKRKKFHKLFDNVFLNEYKYHPKIKMNAKSQRELKMLNVGATMYFVSSLDDELFELKTAAKKVLRGKPAQINRDELSRIVRNLPVLAHQVWRYKVQHRAYNPEPATIWLRVHCEQEPMGASSVSLSGERDALGMLRTRLDWRISNMEQQTILDFALIAQQELSKVANITLDTALAQGDASFRLRCDDSNHHMGGMRMASTISEGLVDSNLRLFGTSNCYVCSGAVFPSSGFSNPTHTVLALAMRLADHLQRAR